MTPRPTPLQRLIGPEPKSEGASVLMSRADYEAANLATFQLEHDQAGPRLRRAAGLDAWAHAFGVTSGALEHWLGNRRSPSLANLVRLGRALRSLTLTELERDRGTSARRGSVRWEDVVDEGGDG